MNHKNNYIGTFDTESLKQETNRRLLVQIYYPVDNVEGEKQFSYRYLSDKKRKILSGIRKSGFRPYAANFGYRREDEDISAMPDSHQQMSVKLNQMYRKNYFFPALLGKMPMPIQQMTAYVGNAYQGAAISDAEENYPVIIVSHGWVGNKDGIAYIAETLAMNGYIVASIQHTYFSMITLFPNGDVAGFRPNLFADHSRIMAADENIVIADLKSLNKSHAVLKDKLDFDRLGVVGYSAGASGAMWNAAHNPEIKAFLGIDASADHLEEATIQAGMPVTSMFLRSEERKVFADTEKLKELQSHSSALLVYMVPNTKHMDFNFMPYGPLRPDRMRIQNATLKIILNFLEYVLRREENELFVLPEQDENIEKLFED